MFRKGMAKIGGRKAGTPNKLTRAFREGVLHVYDAIGGDEAFAKWAAQHRTEFYKIAARLIPAEMGRHESNEPVVVVVNRSRAAEPLTIEHQPPTGEKNQPGEAQNE
ncbi:hypothetical protein [Nitrospira sp. Nam74]